MKALAALALLSALSACSPPDSQPAGKQAESARSCIANADAQWTRDGAPILDATASTQGTDCAHATATLTIRDLAGVTVYQQDFRAASITALTQADNAASMQTALARWIDQAHPTLKSTSQLPPWPEGAASPAASGFPFVPDASLTRDAYVALRATPLPLYCVAQAAASQVCLAWRNNELDKVGSQTFGS